MMSILQKPIVLIDAPSNLGLMPPQPGRVPGVYQMPDALRAAGILQASGAQDGGRVDAPAYVPDIDPAIRVRNPASIRDYTLELAQAVEPIIQAGQFPLVLGGDCSILLGDMLALRRIGRYGLFFLDGHADFLTPQTSRTGGAAGMDLALVTGRGPEILTTLEGYKPLVQDADVVLFGNRDNPSSYDITLPEAMHTCDLWQMREAGVEAAINAALEHFRARNLDGFWIHFDVDALDNAIMPAVDSPQPDGVTYAEMRIILRTLLASGMVAGMEITIFDPDLDPDGHIAREFVIELAGIFSAA
ncbi:MAG TPA: arginase family protein [Spirillospora sp.]|nr:arginase family protein [Spirillospora sp.]